MGDLSSGEADTPDEKGQFLSLRPVAPLTVPFALRNEVFHPAFWIFFGGPVLYFGSITLLGVSISPGNPFLAPPVELAVVGGLFGVVLAWVYWTIGRRRWIQVTLDGFILTERGQSTTYRDEDVLGISLWRTKDLRSSSSRVVYLEWTTPGGPRVLRCRYSPPQGLEDPLGAFWKRLERGVAARTLDRLDAGASLAGPGWRLDASGLHIGRDGECVVALAELEKAVSLDGCLLLWKAQEEAPFWKVDLRTRNARVLARILRRKVSRPAPVLTGNPFGRALLVRQDTVWPVYAFCLVAVAAGVAVLSGLDPAPDDPYNLPHMLFLLSIPTASLGLFYLWFFLRLRTITFYEHGVAQLTPRGRKSLLYSEVNRIIYNGKGRITFEPNQASGKVIRYWSVWNRRDPDIDRLLRGAAETMADAWEERWQQGPLEWTDQLRFLPGALECRRSRSSRAEPLRIPYQRLEWKVSGDRLLLYERRALEPAFRARVAVPNFLVGLALLGRIVPDGEIRPRSD